jgi:hypothetical protein
MKSRSLRYFGRIAALALASTLAVTGTAFAQDGDWDGHSLQGTWRVQVTQYNCATGAAVPSFWSLLSFHRGGTESETTSNPALQPGQRTSSYGFWKPAREADFCSADREADYFSATEAFILSDSPTNPPGLKKGAQKIMQCITMKGDDSWTSNATVTFFNNDGTTTTGCAKAAGTRLSGSTTEP